MSEQSVAIGIRNLFEGLPTSRGFIRLEIPRGLPGKEVLKGIGDGNARVAPITSYISDILDHPSLFVVILAERVNYQGFELTTVTDTFSVADLRWATEDHSVRTNQFCKEAMEVGLTLYLMHAICKGNFDAYVESQLKEEEEKRTGLRPGGIESPIYGRLDYDSTTRVVIKFLD